MSDPTLNNTNEKFCQACGHTIKIDAAFCSHCGKTQPVQQMWAPFQSSAPGFSPQQNINLNLGSKQTNVLAIAALVMAILIVFTGGLTFLPAIICGHIARNATNRDPNLGGAGMALASLIISYVILGLIVLGVILAGCIGVMVAASQ